MCGTRWVKEGEGATIAELAEVLREYDTQTSLVLTGQPITVYDLFHIKDALRKVNWEKAFIQNKV